MVNTSKQIIVVLLLKTNQGGPKVFSETWNCLDSGYINYFFQPLIRIGEFKKYGPTFQKQLYDFEIFT